MVAQMSSKSRIYHRCGCRYINRISEKHMVVFDPEDGRIKKLEPCKYCCNIKYLYEQFKPNLRTVFEDLDIAVEINGAELRVHTPWYNWKLWIEQSSQDIRVFRQKVDLENDNEYFYPVKYYEKTKDFGTVMRFIASEERLALYPEPFRSQACQIVKYSNQKGMTIKFDGSDLYVLTDIAAWKIAYSYHNDRYKLLHSPFGESKMTMGEAVTAHYHVQKDVIKKLSPFKLIQYIEKHDNAKKIAAIDYKYLPRATKKQRKYYRQAENREKRKSIRRVLDLFAELDAKREMAVAR